VTSRENINKAYPELKRLHELVQDPAALSRRLGKLADELAKDPELRRVVERLCDILRKGEAAQKVNKACLTPFLTPFPFLREKRLLTPFPLRREEKISNNQSLSPTLSPDRIALRRGEKAPNAFLPSKKRLPTLYLYALSLCWRQQLPRADIRASIINFNIRQIHCAFLD
jgi:hypothetical protein